MQVDGLPFEGRHGYPQTEPTLPLKATGKIPHQGGLFWTRWAVDGDGNTWRDNADGGSLRPCNRGELPAMAEPEDEEEYEKILAALGEE